MAAKKTTVIDETPVVTEEPKTIKTAKVAVEVGINLRAEKSLDADVLTVLANGTEVTLVGKTSNGWQKVTVEDKTGYVVAEYLTF